MAQDSPRGAADEPQDFQRGGKVTDHVLALPDREIAYRAHADWISLRKIHKPVAHLFCAAYIAEPVDVARPLTFVFNGGPGAASAYLHMGGLGPRRVAFGPSGTLPPPPIRLVDNLESWLTFTDLVFIDPVGTGFSRSLKSANADAKSSAKSEEKPADGDPEENPEFWEVTKDLDSLGEFISRFLSQHQRWTSPIFIAGESYGGFRVAKMARKLQEGHGVGLCGALLISPAIELDALMGSDYNLTYWMDVFPSLAAAAHHHGRTRDLPEGETLAAVLERAETFAKQDLARLLVRGEELPADQRNQIVQQAASIIGLDASIVDRAAGRITSTVFCRELLRDQQRLVGHYDASVTTVDPFPDRNDYEGPDPTLASIDRLFTGAINQHLRATLQVETDLDYRLLSRDINKAWTDASKGHFFRAVLGAMDDLRYGMSLNEHMRVSITHGYFDLVTPYFSSQRLGHLMKLTPAQQENLEFHNYFGGHMFYSWDDSRAALQRHTQQFYEKAMGDGAATA